MACRLPGGIKSPKDLWDFLLEGRDGRSRVPKTRFNIDGYYSPTKRAATAITEHGYFLDESVDLGALDTSFFSMTRTEVEYLDPQQKLMLEVARESLDDAGEVGTKGSNIGVYVGSFGQDWYDILAREGLRQNSYTIVASHDFMLSERISHEMDLKGPSLTIRTACSSSLVGLNEACMAIAKGDCESAIVGGTSLILAPDVFTRLSYQGVLSPDGSCKTFSADANGYGRGEAVVSVYIKSLSAALRDGNSIRSVISGSATNFDGKTNPLTTPSASAQELLIRKAYEHAGIEDIGKTGLFECHGTGTYAGDPIEAEAIASVFGEKGIYVGAVKPNLGHSEGASGLTAVLKATLALEHRIIPPNIKFSPLNPRIPFEKAKLRIPEQPTKWPADRDDRVSINAFGVGGANAHVIVESAASWLASHQKPRPTGSETTKAAEPQLLLFSANTAQSLKDLVSKYQILLSETSLDVANVAYTLANRREHFTNRSFAIATKDKFDVAASVTAQKDGSTPPSVVMVFTGQGAAWPQVGRTLLLSNTTFSHTIDLLDKHLQHLGAIWSLKEELLKPARTSRVFEAEFSQPLCTALQLALVDTLAAVGIKPAAVVGHSSGEIGAAYAAGALTAEEAITVAYLRGTATKHKTQHGGMAAVGLGWDDIQEYLVPRVVTACDNSPSSVTISGDADKLETVIAAVKQAHPDVPTTTLKVEQAYHSHHMLAFGQAYYQAMVNCGVVGRTPTVPFFSSVTGELLTSSKISPLGPSYWQANLERPVLFRSAVTNILKSAAIINPVFLELGPHSALAGPLRQILTSESSGASYVSSLVRRQNSAENLLQAIGKLYMLQASIDFKSISPTGSCLPDLPAYPWDHSRRHMFESRVTKEWLGKKYPDHTLLGGRVPESTDLEPVWRNLLQVDTTPWIVDHKLGDNIVFPLAGYVAVAAEAARQVSGIDDGVSFRNIAVSSALVLNDDAPTEIITTMRRKRLTDSQNSEWWEFGIASHNGHVWTKHASGEVKGETFDKMQQLDDTEEELPRKVDSTKWYDSTARQGITYGPTFSGLENIKSSTGWPNKSTATMKNNKWGDEAQHHLHPIILDTYYQLMSCALHDGLDRDFRRTLAARIDSMIMFRCSEDNLKIAVRSEPTQEGYIAYGSVSAGSKIVLKVDGSHSTLFEEAEAGDKSSIPITARTEWVPHVDFIDRNSLIKSRPDQETIMPLINQLSQLVISLASRATIKTQVLAPHLIKYKKWLHEQAPSGIDTLDSATLTQSIQLLIDKLQATSAGHAAAAIVAVSSNIEALLSGEKTVLEVLNSTGSLDSFTEFLREHDDGNYLRCIGHSKPNISILEIGAGLGEKTSKIIKYLSRADGQPLYSQYVVVDASSGLVNAAREGLKGVPNLEFITLDVSRDLAEQGFEDRQFDVIVAANIASTGNILQDSLRNLYRLLRPHGKLILEESRPGLSWAKFVLGLLPRWWAHASDMDRVGEPFIGPERWQDELAGAGFAVVDHIKPDSEHWTNSVLIATPQHLNTPDKHITLLSLTDMTQPSLIVQELENRGYKIDRILLGETPPADQDVLAILEEEQPFFENLDAEKLSQFKTLLTDLGSAGLLWVTRPSSIGVTDPRYAQVIGLVRTLRSELSIDIATVETDRIETPLGAIYLADVVSKFLARGDDGALGPDLEYAIHKDQILVNRIFPFSLEQDLIVSQASAEAVVTQTIPGRLNTITWSTLSPTAPKDDEIEVEVYASGVNFRDVLVGMQIIPGRHEPKFGYETTGIVRRVGPRVTKLTVGDRVVGVGARTFTTVITSREVYYEKLPDHINFVEAACIPTIFLTVVHGLRDLGRLERGQSVLIHSGAGGVGLAAIQVAQMLGAEIYTTVGSENKVKYLMDTFHLPRNRIFNSRNESFVQDLLRETNGKGVDVALNSLAGELLHATWKCVGRWGTMVEIGKRDLIGNAQLDMGPFLASRNYCCIDIDQMRSERPEMISRLLQSVMDSFAKGFLKPIRIDRVFSGSEVLEALRYMQQGKHMGKIVLEIREPSGKLLVDNVDATKKSGAEFDEAASYLLVGGLGGLGRSISVWMVQRGARNLSFLSRSAGSGEHDADFVREIESMGCTVQLVKGDVTNAGDVTRAVDGVLAPLKGIVQMSMVLRDQMFDGMSIEDWNAVTKPKVQGTWNLHNATLSKGIDLDFFLLFSSLSGIVGQVGQSNYASANTFLDAFVQYRARHNLPCTAIDLGAMKGVGYLSENTELLRKMQGTGWSVVQETELLGALDLAMMTPATRNQRKKANSFGDTFLLGLVPTVPLNSPSSSSRLKRDVRMAIYHNIDAGNHLKAGSAPDGLRAFLASVKQDPSVLKTSEAVEILAVEIARKLFSLLLAEDAEIDITQNTADLGLDSLVAVELRAWWKLNLGFDISTLDMLSLGTAEALGKRAVDGLIALHGP
ncbi:hypothetical protein M441DRAFT_166252 [Trichoderma asperellum CBS 433.97]|uniref:Uncharacterized protein n=1 Tax=Trichoderma asperellum (strain ATCC 204424 / CBS 433.97 / NBRC 101777) TaxID=1042311 RepID=A0A2T3ZD55_TRIA4|nr:hypothetical protein M441DRAFT_166252 [Trichoderma asperellum CBS 433.97]PTB42734.1 hypothetical protein M441DRAFT_166252 [Trichoderma asperellum CBS 433.97]